MIQFEDLRPQPGIRRYFYVQRLCFARVGIDVLSLKRTVTNPCKFWSFTMSQIFVCFLIVLYAIQNKHDLGKATDSLATFGPLVISICKILHFVFNRKVITTLIHKLWLWNLEAKDEEHAILAAENRKDIIFSNSYHYAVATTGLMALVAPFLIAGFYAWHGYSFWEYLGVPAKAAYYIDKKSVAGYITIFLWNVCCDFFLIYTSVAMDSLFSWFTCNIAAHFRILKHRLRQAGDHNNGMGWKKTICECIAYHCRALNIAEDFNNAFRVIVFITFGISCLQICCLAFQLSRKGELFEHVYHGLFFATVFMQLLLYCYGGQMIQDESESIANEIYDSFHWESLTLANRKMLIFSMQRSQAASRVSGILFTANMNLFLWIYRTAFSFITLLWTLEDKENQKH